MARDFPDSYVPTPIDRVAGRILSTGYHHEFKKAENCRESWDTPPEVVPLFQVPEPIKQLFGTRKGSLVMVGYLGRKNSANGKKSEQRLLVRCDCGRYEVRVGRRWRKTGNEIFERCQFCDQREKLKVSHLSNAEKDRIENLKRAQHGLPSKDQEMMDRFKTKIENFYARGRDPSRWKKHKGNPLR